MEMVRTRRSVVQIIGNQAKPGSKLSFLKNMMNFCRDFNKKTEDKNGIMLRTEITVYKDNSFTYVIKNSPISDLLKKLDLKKIVYENDDSELLSLANELKQWFNTNDINKIKKILLGTVKSFNVVK